MLVDPASTGAALEIMQASRGLRQAAYPSYEHTNSLNAVDRWVNDSPPVSMQGGFLLSAIVGLNYTLWFFGAILIPITVVASSFSCCRYGFVTIARVTRSSRHGAEFRCPPCRIR